MKKILLITAACLAGAAANAQISLSCRIKYNYDASGNRIKRYYDCSDLNVPVTNYKPDVILHNLYPNPTIGPLRGTFTYPVGADAGDAIVTLTSISGITVFQRIFTELTSEFDIDISQQLPGTYFLTVYAFDMMESYTVVKLQ